MYDLLNTPLGSDLAYRWIQALFPTDATQPYGQAFAIFTSALTFIGALFMGWHIIIGIVSSAYSGKVLGERYHQIWAPLRVVLGFGLLVPIAGSYSTVHYLLRDVVGVAAIQAANAPIVTYIKGMASEPSGIKPSAMQGKSLAEKVLQLQACAAIVEGINDNAKPYVWNRATAVVMPSDNRSGGWTDGYSWSYGDCGTLFLQDPQPEGEFAEANAARVKDFILKRREATNQLMQDISALIDHKAFGEYFATKEFDPEKPMGAAHAKKLMENLVIAPDIVSRIDKASRDWNEAVSDAAKSVFADSSDEARANLLKRIETYGFMVAGSYERSLSQISAMASSFTGSAPQSTLGEPGSSYSAAYHGSQAAIRAARQAETRTSGVRSGASPDDGAGAAEEIMSAVSPIFQSMESNPEDPDPVGSMISFGHRLLAGAQAAVLSLALISGGTQAIDSNLFTGATGIGGFFVGFFSYFTQWIGYAVLIVFIVGVMHAYVLPMIPMIMVFVMGVSWLVLFLEAAIAGVLWAFAFIRMDGQEFFDRNQAPGVTLLFNLFLRPAIGMLAFIGGLIMMPVLLNGLTLIWDDSFATQTDGLWVNGWLGYIASLVMFCWMQWHLYLRVWGLVPTIADRVGHWMGMQMHGYNDGQETQAATGAMIAAGAAMGKAPIVPQGGRAMARGGGAPGASKTAVNEIAGKAADPGKSRKTTPRR